MNVKTFLTFLASFAILTVGRAQWYLQQYFDGADTVPGLAIIVHIDPDSQNRWQIGPPQKVIFDSAATSPNVMVTDTLQQITGANVSQFQFALSMQSWGWGILAIQWMQKLDMADGTSGGLIEFSTDHGSSWENAFNSPYVYNFYGFQLQNRDTLFTGQEGFVGRDSTWRDIWLCYDLGWGSMVDSLYIRFTFTSDSLAEGIEGWMIDNLLSHLTIAHTLKDMAPKPGLTLYPTVVTDRLNLLLSRDDPSEYIRHIEVMDLEGKLVQSAVGPFPLKFWIDVGTLRSGQYLVRVETSTRVETGKVTIQR